MTDKEKQSCGQLYNPTAGDICTMRKRGTDLARQFNSCEDPDEQKKILQTLFSETGENVRVNPPFYIDFGCHTHIGNDTVINFIWRCYNGNSARKNRVIARKTS